MDFDEGAADKLIAACDKAAAMLREQRGPRVAVIDAALADFRGPFAVLFQTNAAAQLAAWNKLVVALEDLSGQVTFAKSQAAQARQDVKDQQIKALWHLLDEGFVEASGDYLRAQLLGIPTPWDLSEAEVRRPEVVFPSMVFEPHNWASSGGSGTVSAVPDALDKAASLFSDQRWAFRPVCDDVGLALDRFQDSCSWALSDVGTFAPAVSQFNQNDSDDFEKLSQIGDAFLAAGKGGDLSVPVELSATSLALAVSPSEVDGEALLRYFATASPLDLEIASENPEWLTHLASVSPERTAKWWADLHGPGSNVTGGYSAQQLVLLESASKVFGSLDGIPALARVYANKLGAAEDLEHAESLLERHKILAKGNSMAFQDEDERAMVEKEIEYLKSVTSGEVQMYLYDREKSRIIEMLGTPDQNTQRTITYVPGTFTSPKSFYDGEVQEFSRYIVRSVPDTVAFVYKDGLFPGENDSEGGVDYTRILEANNPEDGLDAGRQLARFQQGMRLDPLLQDTEQTGSGHSWGYANLTSSEIHGAEYDKSISLAGAGMHEKWEANTDTQYSHFVYEADALRWAQKTGKVWDDKVPGDHDSFAKHEYSAPSDGTVLPDVISPAEAHSLIVTDSQDNSKVLRDVLLEVMK